MPWCDPAWLRSVLVRGVNMKWCCKGVAIAALLITTSTNAQEFAIWGAGQDSCGSYVLALQKYRPMEMLSWQGENYSTPSHRYAQWISGYVSAVNRMRVDLGFSQIAYKGDINGMALWIKNYCDQHPAELIVSGVDNFVRAYTQGR